MSKRMSGRKVLKSDYRLSKPLTKMEMRENCFLAILYTLLIASWTTIF